MYKIVLRKRAQLNRHNYRKENTKDILLVRQHNLHERVMDKLGYLDNQRQIASINFFRLIFLFNKYPGLKICPKLGKFWRDSFLLRKEKWKK